MRKITILVLFFMTFTTTAFLIFNHQIKHNPHAKQSIKNIYGDVVRRVDGWHNALKKRQKFVAITEEKLLIEGEVIAFTDKLNYTLGEDIVLHLITDQEVKIGITKVDITGQRKSIHPPMYHKSKGETLAVYSSFDGIISKSEKIKFDGNNLETGWLSIDIESSNKLQLNLPIFIDPVYPGKRVLFVESTDTLLAYNPANKVFGIPNNYMKNLDSSESMLVPPKTPILYTQLDYDSAHKISCQDHLLNADMILKKNLADANIKFQTVSDKFLDNPHALSEVDTLIFGTHNEYWTKAKAQNVMKFVDNGGSLLLLGGNKAWRRIYRDDDRTWIHGGGLLDNSVFKSLIHNYLGSYFTSIDYETYASLEVVDEEAIFALFGLQTTRKQLLGTSTRFAHCKTEILGISGHETDKLSDNAKGFKILAKGLNKGGGADVVYKQFPSGGRVLSFGSLSLWHNNDETIAAIIENFLKTKQ